MPCRKWDTYLSFSPATSLKTPKVCYICTSSVPLYPSFTLSLHIAFIFCPHYWRHSPTLKPFTLLLFHHSLLACCFRLLCSRSFWPSLCKLMYVYVVVIVCVCVCMCIFTCVSVCLFLSLSLSVSCTLSLCHSLAFSLCRFCLSFSFSPFLFLFLSFSFSLSFPLLFSLSFFLSLSLSLLHRHFHLLSLVYLRAELNLYNMSHVLIFGHKQ